MNEHVRLLVLLVWWSLITLFAQFGWSDSRSYVQSADPFSGEGVQLGNSIPCDDVHIQYGTTRARCFGIVIVWR